MILIVVLDILFAVAGLPSDLFFISDFPVHFSDCELKHIHLPGLFLTLLNGSPEEEDPCPLIALLHIIQYTF